MNALAMAPAHAACWCGALLREDLTFTAQAERETVPVRLWVCTNAHSHYLNSLGPTAPLLPRGKRQRGARPSDWKPDERRCRACQRLFRYKKRQFICDGCRALPPCRYCNGRGKHYPHCKRLPA